MDRHPPEDLKVLAADIASAAGVLRADAEILADSLVAADLSGIGTHGLSRLAIYLKRIKLGLELANDWRRQSDIAWRTTTWDLRRMVAGGMVLQDSTVEERRAAKLPEDALALRVNHLGEYGDHAVAKRAGFKKDDILLLIEPQSLKAFGMAVTQ